MTAKVSKVAKQCSNVDGIVTVLKNSLHSKGSKSVMGSDDFVFKNNQSWTFWNGSIQSNCRSRHFGWIAPF